MGYEETIRAHLIPKLIDSEKFWYLTFIVRMIIPCPMNIFYRDIGHKETRPVRTWSVPPFAIHILHTSRRYPKPSLSFKFCHRRYKRCMPRLLVSPGHFESRIRPIRFNNENVSNQCPFFLSSRSSFGSENSREDDGRPLVVRLHSMALPQFLIPQDTLLSLVASLKRIMHLCSNYDRMVYKKQ
ncbi:MAG: hypothetical protein RIQ56_948 [Candidatus Parcubacteria bacterium]